MLYFYPGKAIEQKHRKLNQIPDHWGTAVNVQTGLEIWAMIVQRVLKFHQKSFNRRKFFFAIFNAQGEDVVAGTRTPNTLQKKQNKMQKQRSLNGRSYT